MMAWRVWLRNLWAAWAPRRSVKTIEGDMLPERLPLRNLVLAREDREDWCIGMRCPCGCGERLELMLLKEVRPRWDVSFDARGRVTLHPSVWLKQGCRSHFWLRDGRVIWCY